MKKQRIPWGKAPELDRCVLIGHSFNGNGYGLWEYMGPSEEYSAMQNYSKPSGLFIPDNMSWDISFTPAPRKRK